MKNLLLAIIIACLYTFKVQAQNELKMGTKAPGIEFQKAFQKGYIIPKGKPILLDFWATWCAPCVAGLLETNEMVPQYADRIEFIAITDTTSSNIERFIRSKNFRHQFILDKGEGITTKSFGVELIPYAFLIDKNGIVQWTGYGREVNSKLLDEFLATGVVKKTELPIPMSSSQSGSKPPFAPLGNFIFEVSENRNPDMEYSFRKGFDRDTFDYGANYQPIREIITSLYNDQSGRIIYPIEKTLFDRPLSVKLLAYNVDPEKTKTDLIQWIGTRYGFNCAVRDIDTLIWELTVTDTVKLSKARTIMQGKGSHGAGKMTNSIKRDGFSTALNATLPELAQHLERQYGGFFKTNTVDTQGYDFIKVPATTFEQLKAELLKNYGVSLTAQKQKLPFLEITLK